MIIPDFCTLVVLAIVLIVLVGNLTYADYYTKLSDDTRETLIPCVFILIGIFVGNFAIAALADWDLFKGYRYASYWMTGCLGLIVICVVLSGICSGYLKLKNYFGRKRGKL